MNQKIWTHDFPCDEAMVSDSRERRELKFSVVAHWNSQPYSHTSADRPLALQDILPKDLSLKKFRENLQLVTHRMMSEPKGQASNAGHQL